MFGISYGELFLLLGATAALIGPKDLPVIARTGGRLVGRAVAYVQLARGQFESLMQQSQARQVHKELQDKMTQLETILYEIRSASTLRPGPMTRRMIDDLADPSAAADGSGVAETSGVVNVSTATVSRISNDQSRSESISATTVSKIYASSLVSDSSNVHSQATAYARLAESAAVKASLDSEQKIDGPGLLHVLPVSAESTGMLPNRQGSTAYLSSVITVYVGCLLPVSYCFQFKIGTTYYILTEEVSLLIVIADKLNGSDIMLEAIVEAEVAHNAKRFFAQPENQIKQDGEVEKR
ncbi:unnamed protein product [Linum tenue]|uniref:Sec-independent protein translocase protein TatB n=1 Tax=Linum tenue TaxID=586396 RepID=A0AAV0LL09_9ROSI|nr:unnamed protein product [Linum tenue]